MDLKQELHGIITIAKREFFSNFFSVRMLILFIIFTLTVLGVAYGLSDASIKQKFLLGGELTANFILVKIAQAVLMVGSLSAIVLSFDSIVKERLTGNIEILLTKPISKRGLLIGKFLGTTFSLLLLVSFISVISLITIARITNSLPSFLASVGFLLFTIVLLGTFVLIQQIFSSLSKNLGTAIVSGIALWFVFVFFWLLITLAIAYSLGIPIYTKGDIMSGEFDYTKDFQMLNVKIGLLNPGGAYMLSIGMLIEENERESALENIPFWTPFVSMILWFVISLFLATEVFKRTQE